MRSFATESLVGRKLDDKRGSTDVTGWRYGSRQGGDVHRAGAAGVVRRYCQTCCKDTHIRGQTPPGFDP